jgi:hypothetical protein
LPELRVAGTDTLGWAELDFTSNYSFVYGIVEFQRADGMAGCFACPAVGQLRGWVE